MHVQSVQNYCFLLSNMQICDVLVAVVFAVALSSLKVCTSRLVRKIGSFSNDDGNGKKNVT